MSTLTQKRASLAERLDMEPAKLELIRSQCIGPEAPDDVLELYLERCRYMGADPFSKMLYVVNRKKNVKDDVTGQWIKVDNWVFQSSIDLFRGIAEENGDYAGQLGPFWTSDGTNWVDVWLSNEPPKACKIAILRNTFKEPLWVTGTYEYYAPRDSKGAVTSNFWKGEKGAHQLAKCVEALALRKAFPQKLNKVYTAEEMEQANRTQPPSLTPALNAAHPDAIDADFEAAESTSKSQSDQDSSDDGKKLLTPPERAKLNGRIAQANLPSKWIDEIVAEVCRDGRESVVDLKTVHEARLVYAGVVRKEKELTVEVPL